MIICKILRTISAKAYSHISKTYSHISKGATLISAKLCFIYFYNSPWISCPSLPCTVGKHYLSSLYWTIDDNWLLNEGGERVCANAQVPKLKIGDDYWWVSYDNGVTFCRLI